MQNQSSFNHTEGWDTFNLSLHNVLLVINIIGALLHYTIWIQLFVQKIKFNLSFIFALCYIGTDLFLTTFYFIQHAIRIRSWISITPVFCCFEAYAMFYFNIYESYCLTALNIGRYWQIVRHQNMYTIHRRKILLYLLVISLWILLNFIIQDLFGWCIVTEIVGASCSLTYTNIFVQIWNIVMLLILPIVISWSMLYRALYCIHHSYEQQTIVRRNHHRRLIIYALMFYSIWICFWGPYMFMVFVNVQQITNWLLFVGTVANTMEIAVDPVIGFFLDKRFAQAWRKCFHSIARLVKCHLNVEIHPTTPFTTKHQTNP